jgi:hypothetical protein
VPSGSEPAIELLPLQLCPRVLAYMAEPIEYSDEKDRRLLSAASTSGRGGRHTSGSISAFTGARLARVPSSVGVVSVSSIAEPLWMLLLAVPLAWPKKSKRLSDAFDVRRAGICRIACEPDGGSETLALPTMSPSVSGSLDLAFLSAGDDPLAAVSCCHDCVLSALTVRDSAGSMSMSRSCVSTLGICSNIASSTSERSLSHDVGGRFLCRVQQYSEGHQIVDTLLSSAAEPVFNSASLHTTWQSMREPLIVNGRASCNVPAITSLGCHPYQHILRLVYRVSRVY